jgi:hypothetical protein
MKRMRWSLSVVFASCALLVLALFAACTEQVIYPGAVAADSADSASDGSGDNGASGQYSGSLTLGSWNYGNLAASQAIATYAVAVIPGQTYLIEWNDSYNGDGAQTADILVSADDGNVVHFAEVDNGWSYNALSIVTTSSTLYITVTGYQGSTGTYALRVIGSSTPASSWTSGSSSAASGYSVQIPTSSSATYAASSASGYYSSLDVIDWTAGTISAGDTVTWTASVNVGTTYQIRWNDSYDGDGTMTADIVVTATDGTTEYFSTDSGYLTGRFITATSSILEIIVTGYDDTEAGSYAFTILH